MVSRRLPRTLIIATILGCGAAASAEAQVVVVESVGERALGMAGAFVGVADDATAVAWNPAGLATAGPAGMTIGWHKFQVRNPSSLASPGASRQSATLTSLGTWPLGVSYGTVRVTELVGEPGNLRALTARISQAGVSIVQSVVNGLVVGSTIKVLRGALGASPVVGPTVGDALSAGAETIGPGHTALDLDVSVMASAPKARIGLLLKNLRSPNFDVDPETPSPLPRQARLGLALLPTDGVTLAMDVDLNTVDLTGGLRRMFALGGEAAIGSRFSVRSGVRWSLKGAHSPTGSVGASIRIRRALWLDGHYAAGRSDEAREGGIALRAGI